MRNRMGTFYTNCKVENHVDRKKSAEVPKMLVDDRAEFTRISAETLKNIGVKREKKDYTFVMANGQHITRPVGFAILHVGDAVTIDEVIFGEPGDLQILGARSLEGMNLRVDSHAKKLVAGGPILAAAQKEVKAVTSQPMMNKQHDDGLEWLRELRQKISAECGHDIHAINEVYRAAAARVPHQSYLENVPAKRPKRKTLANG